jgi:putative membrane protein
MKVISSTVVLLAAAGFSVSAFAGKLSHDDQEFFKKAAVAGMTEVEAGKIASTQASDPEVRNFAQQMVTDHSGANDQLKALASKKGVSLPAGPGHEEQEALAKLKAKSGHDFDEEYMERMVKDHHDAVDLFKETAEDSKDPDIKEFASKTLPTLQHHDEMAKDLEKKTDKG